MIFFLLTLSSLMKLPNSQNMPASLKIGWHETQALIRLYSQQLNQINLVNTPAEVYPLYEEVNHSLSNIKKKKVFLTRGFVYNLLDGLTTYVFWPCVNFFFFFGEIPALWQQAINLCCHSIRTDAYTEIKSNTEHRRNTQVEINSIFSLAYKTQIGFQRITKTQGKKTK